MSGTSSKKSKVNENLSDQLIWSGTDPGDDFTSTQEALRKDYVWPRETQYLQLSTTPTPTAGYFEQIIEHIKSKLRSNNPDAGCRDKLKADIDSTETKIYARVFYAIRDSLKMDSAHFAELYNPTGVGGFPMYAPPGEKSGVLLCVDIGVPSRMGNVDLDHAMLYADWPVNFGPARKVLKKAWNLKRGENANYNIEDPAEEKALIMGREMRKNKKRFHEYFPDLIKRAKDPNDPVNKAKATKDLIGAYHDNF